MVIFYMLEKLSEVTFVLQRWAVCKKGPPITNFQIGGLAKFVRLTDLPQMFLSRSEEFAVSGLEYLRNLRLCDEGMRSTRNCEFAIVGFKKVCLHTSAHYTHHKNSRKCTIDCTCHKQLSEGVSNSAGSTDIITVYRSIP